MYSNGREVALAQQLVQLSGTERRLDEDDDLIILELIEEVIELAILLSLSKLEVVLLQSMKCKLGFVINVDLERVLHELLADWACLLGKRGREHHDLFLSWCCTEDLLHIAAHICAWSVMTLCGSTSLTNLIEHLVTFIKNELLNATQTEMLVSNESI